MKFVKPLNSLTKSWLEIIKNSTLESSRTRNRAHAVMLSSEGLSIKDLQIIFKATHKTISKWIDSWEIQKFDSLLDAKRSGRPVKIKKSQEQDIIRMIQDHPRQLNTVLQKLSQELKLFISKKTLKRFLKKEVFLGDALENL